LILAPFVSKRTAEDSNGGWSFPSRKRTFPLAVFALAYPRRREAASGRKLEEDAVIYRTLGRTGLRVSLAGLGTGGPSKLGQETHKSEAEAHRVIHRALDLGINLFDAAANYGDSEAILGRALRDVPRERFILATKCAPCPNIVGPHIISTEELTESCERSLRRLQVDTIDIFQLHSVVPEMYHSVVDQLYPAAKRLQDQGKVRFLGITEYFFPDAAHKMLELALADDLWDTIMVKYGIMNLAAEWKVLPLAHAGNVGVLNMSPVRVKLTRTGAVEKVIARWKAAGLIAPDCLPDQRPLDFLVHGPVESLAAAGYKFGAGHDGIHSVLIGTGSVVHLEQNVAAILGPPLPEEDGARIRALFGHLAESEGDTE
jgi:L-galactose dehydrogenase